MATHPDRIPTADVNPLFLERWSPRAFSSEPLPQATIDSLFEAARFAPSCLNEQPWLFLYASTPEELARFRPLLVEGNQVWANKAPVLVYVFARKTFAKNGTPNRFAAFDTGAATMALVAQAHMLGLVTHAMGGIKVDEIHATLGVPKEEYEVICGLVIGKYGNPEELPEPLRAREKPQPRKPRAEVALHGAFRKPGT